MPRARTLSGSSGSSVLGRQPQQDRTGQHKREEAVQGKRGASLWRPASILDRTRRFTPQVRSPGGPACPEGPGRTGHQRTASGWGSVGPYLLLLLLFLREWAAVPGFPPTQGLPEILRSNGTDGSEADAPKEGKSTTRHSPEPPLLSLTPPASGYFDASCGRASAGVINKLQVRESWMSRDQVSRRDAGWECRSRPPISASLREQVLGCGLVQRNNFLSICVFEQHTGIEKRL